MKLQLDEAITSPQDFRAVILELKRASSWFAQDAVKTKVTGTGSEGSPNVSETTTRFVHALTAGQALTRQHLDELINNLESLEASLPRVTITLGALPQKKLKQLLVSWFRKNLDPNALVDIRFNATLLGGMVVQYGSHIHDWSFRRQILAARDKFPEVLRRV